MLQPYCAAGGNRPGRLVVIHTLRRRLESREVARDEACMMSEMALYRMIMITYSTFRHAELFKETKDRFG